MSSDPKFEVTVPSGVPPKLFIPLYADLLRAKLSSLLGMQGFNVTSDKAAKESYAIHVLKGRLSGMELAVESKYRLLAAPESIVTVTAKPYSWLEHLLVRLMQIAWVLLAIPVFFLVLPVVHFIIVSFIIAVLLLAPIMMLVRAGIAALTRLLYSSFGNEIDDTRREALLGQLKSVAPPDPLAALRAAAAASPAAATSATPK